MRIRFVHAYSLVLGGLFRVSYWGLGMNNNITNYFFERYKETRRLLPGVTKGPNGYSTRYGAPEAHSSTQER